MVNNTTKLTAINKTPPGLEWSPEKKAYRAFVYTGTRTSTLGFYPTIEEALAVRRAVLDYLLKELGATNGAN